MRLVLALALVRGVLAVIPEGVSMLHAPDGKVRVLRAMRETG